MAQPEIPTCCELFGRTYTPPQILQFIYCLLYSINENTGGSSDTNRYTSVPILATGNGSIPAGVLGWSITAVSGTVAVNGQSLAVGGRFSGGGYGSYISTSAIAYTISGGSALVIYDLPA